MALRGRLVWMAANVILTGGGGGQIDRSLTGQDNDLKAVVIGRNQF
jgi:hypothetical protein